MKSVRKFKQKQKSQYFEKYNTILLLSEFSTKNESTLSILDMTSL